MGSSELFAKNRIVRSEEDQNKELKEAKTLGRVKAKGSCSVW